MNKLEMAHDWYLKHAGGAESHLELEVSLAWTYADAMQSEADKREKEKAEQKHKEIRELLNADNTFIEKEGQHFDDVESMPIDELNKLSKSIENIQECKHEWDHVSAYGGTGDYYVCPCGAEKHNF